MFSRKIWIFFIAVDIYRKRYSTDSLHTNAQRSPVAVQVRFSVIFSYPFSDFRFRYISTAMKNIKFSAKTQLDEVVIDRFLAHQCTTKPGCCSGEIFCNYFDKVENFLKVSLNLILSPSPFVKILVMGEKV